MRMLERTALIVRAKRRFVEWANSVTDEKLTLEEARLSPRIYLVELIEDEDEQRQLVEAYGEEVFELELSLVTDDESSWPLNRKAAVFRDWFDIEAVEFVGDALEDEPLYDDMSEDDLSDDDDPHEDGTDEDMSDEDFAARVLESVQSSCAWCDRVLAEDASRLTVSMRHADPGQLAQFHGSVLPVGLIGHDVAVYGIVPAADSQAWSDNAHILFTCCSDECAAELRDALRRDRPAQLS